MCKFKGENYITIPGFAVVRLGLSGNELICYSLIYGFTQDGETEFHGSLSYLSSALNITKGNAKKVLDRLCDKGLIVKREVFVSGVKFCHYIASGMAETDTPLSKQTRGMAETVTGGMVETITNNIDIDNDKDNNIPADGGLFPCEVVKSSVNHTRRTSENLCLFANSRYADMDAFRAEFSAPEFAVIDIVYYYHAVADWSAQKGKKMRDWIATARNFIRRDMETGKVHKLKSGAYGLTPDALAYLEAMK